MKRSEAVSEIANLLMNQHLPEHQTHDTGVYCLKQAELILESLETLGMLPPITKLSLLNVMDNCWDPED